MDIEDTFGLLFFLAFAAFGMFSNYRKQQEEEKKRQNTPKKVRPDELPEVTRRMLYGERDQEVQTAQPRQAAPRHVENPTAPPFVTNPRPAAPRTTPPPIREQIPFPREYQAPPLRPSMGPMPVAPPQPQSPEQSQVQTMQADWEKAQAVQKELVRQMEAKREQLILEQKRLEQEAKRRSLAAIGGSPLPQSKPQRPKHKKSQAHTRPSSVNVQALFHDLRNVRKGVIMQEVLGPPKALQDF